MANVIVTITCSECGEPFLKHESAGIKICPDCRCWESARAKASWRAIRDEGVYLEDWQTKIQGMPWYQAKARKLKKSLKP